MPWHRVSWSIALAVVVVGMLTAPATARDEVLGAHGAVVTVPESPVTRALAPLQGCQSLLAAGSGDCAVVRTAHGPLIVTVEPAPRVDAVLVTRPWTVRVYRPAVGVRDGWQVALETRAQHDDRGALLYPGPLYAGVTAKTVDVTRDGHDDIVLGYRSEGTGMILDIDVVTTDRDGSPQVLAHDQLYKGTVIFRHGNVIAFQPVYRRSDANCCPTWIERDELRFRDGALHVETGPRVRARGVDLPPSELG